MSSTSLQVLQSIFGYPEFRGPQEAIIDAVCEGRDCLVLMPTGGGKSLCYQIPAMLRPGIGIVVSPLIALMRDQVQALLQLGVRAAFLNSSLRPAEQREVETAVAEGRLDLLYVAPERLLAPDTLEFLKAQAVSLIAIDEAHCVSAWGHDFRSNYLELHQLATAFPGVPRLALTATADDRTREDIVARLALDQPVRFVSGFDRPNIRYAVEPKSQVRRQLGDFLSAHGDQSGIIYCLSRKSVESTAEWLQSEGHRALPYHAGLDPTTRNEHQHRFLSEEAVIIVATIAFGMGIDKPDVRFVAHLDLPKSIEAYYQETGRAGRDGLPADAWMIYGLQDVVRLSAMMNDSQAEEPHKRIERAKLDSLLGWCELTTCRRQSLLAYFGETLMEPCGNCDTCLNPPQTWDATNAAQKALSCVYRTGQRFGAGHVIDVLRGQDRDKIHKFRHDRLSTYGIGAEYSDVQWRSIFRQLVVRGFLRADPERFGALRLHGSSRQILRGEQSLELREVAEKVRAPRKSRDSGFEIAPDDQPLWDRLREHRRRLAEAQGVPPYVVFHDATLKEMIRLRPSTPAELLTVTGIGKAKLERYGDEFLNVLQDTEIEVRQSTDT